MQFHEKVIEHLCTGGVIFNFNLRGLCEIFFIFIHNALHGKF